MIEPAIQAAPARSAAIRIDPVTFDVTTSSAIESAVAPMEAEIAPIGIPVPDAGLARRGNTN